MTRDIDLILAMMDEGLIGGDDVQAVHSLGPDSVSQRLAASAACEAFGTPLNSANAKKTENANWKRIHAAYSRLGAHALAANPDWRASMRQAEDEHGHGHEYKPLSRVKMLLRCLTMALYCGAPRGRPIARETAPFLATSCPRRARTSKLPPALSLRRCRRRYT